MEQKKGWVKNKFDRERGGTQGGGRRLQNYLSLDRTEKELSECDSDLLSKDRSRERTEFAFRWRSGRDANDSDSLCNMKSGRIGGHRKGGLLGGEWGKKPSDVPSQPGGGTLHLREGKN